MAKNITPSYPVTGKQAKELVKEAENSFKGIVDQRQARLIEENAKKALHFLKNSSSILSTAK